MSEYPGREGGPDATELPALNNYQKRVDADSSHRISQSRPPNDLIPVVDPEGHGSPAPKTPQVVESRAVEHEPVQGAIHTTSDHVAQVVDSLYLGGLSIGGVMRVNSPSLNNAAANWPG